MKKLIVLPVFNRSAIINEAIIKLSKEIDSDFEILIVDDGSEDDTAEIVETDSQVKYIQHENSLGFGGCLINALDYAKMHDCSLLFLLDISYPGFIRAFKEMKESSQDYDILNCSRYTSVTGNQFPAEDYLNYNFSKQISSKINLTTEYNLEDFFSPFKTLRLEALKDMALEEFDEGFFIQLFIQAKHFKLKVREFFCDSIHLEINNDDLHLENDIEYYLTFIDGENLLYPVE